MPLVEPVTTGSGSGAITGAEVVVVGDPVELGFLCECEPLLPAWVVCEPPLPLELESEPEPEPEEPEFDPDPDPEPDETAAPPDLLCFFAWCEPPACLADPECVVDVAVAAV